MDLLWGGVVWMFVLKIGNLPPLPLSDYIQNVLLLVRAI